MSVKNSSSNQSPREFHVYSGSLDCCVIAKTKSDAVEKAVKKCTDKDRLGYLILVYPIKEDGTDETDESKIHVFHTQSIMKHLGYEVREACE